MSYFEKLKASDFMLEVASGEQAGISSINKFGENRSSTSGTMLPVWSGGTVYTYPTTATMTHLSQTADDIPMRGQVVEVQGLDASWALTIQNVTLDATLTTTPVALATPLIRVFRMKVLANVSAAQNVNLKNAAGTTLYATIDNGVSGEPYNQTLMAMYTVPAGKTAYMVNYYGDVLEDPVATKDPDATEFLIWAADRANGYEFQIKNERGIVKGAPGFMHEFRPYIKFTEKTDIRMDAECSGKTGHVHGGFDLILVDN